MSYPSYPLVSFGLDDVNVKTDISSLTTVYGVTHEQSFCNLNDLQLGRKTITPFATFEPNYWVLDGNHHFMPSSPTVGLMANALSDASGNIPTNLVLTIFFSSVQSLRYLSLFFDVGQGEWCSSIKVDFWTSGGVMLWGGTVVSPTSTEYDIDAGSIITNVDHVNITLYKTNNPYRFARLTAIDFGANGTVTHLDSTKIQKATITEELSPISDTLTANKIDIALILDVSDFSVVNPATPYVNLEQNMPFTVWEVIDNVTNLMGVFYLDKWENSSSSQRVVTFHCYDAMWLLAKMPFYGFIYGGISLSSVIAQIFSGTNIPYTLNSTDYPGGFNIHNPNIQPCSLRDALQQIAMACRMSISTKYSLGVTLQKVVLAQDMVTPDYTITTAQEMIKNVYLRDPIKGVRLSETGWQGAGATPVQIYTATLAAGNYIIPIKQTPVGQVISISGATVLTPTWYYGNAFGIFFVGINVASPGTVTINSAGGDLISINIEDVLYQPGTIPNATQIIDINETVESDAGAGTRSDQAIWIFNYFNQRYVQEATIYGELVGVGDMIKIESHQAIYLNTCIEKATIELVGLRADIESIGVLA